MNVESILGAIAVAVLGMNAAASVLLWAAREELRAARTRCARD